MTIYGVRWVDEIKYNGSMYETVEEGVLKWTQGEDDKEGVEVEGTRKRGKRRKRWKDGVKDASKVQALNMLEDVMAWIE